MNGHEIEEIIGKKIVDWINDHAPLKVKALLGAIAAGIAAFFLFMMAGCCNIQSHVNGKVSRCYMGTVCVCEMMQVFPEVMIVPGIIDLPLEVVADTVTFPYDVFKTRESRD